MDQIWDWANGRVDWVDMKMLPTGWQLMGALEALNGWILFGLTTAFLFSVMQKEWSGAEAEC